MRLGLIAAVLASGIAVAPSAAAPPPAQERPTADASEPIPTRQTAFTIPFRLDKPQTPAEQPVEVQLHVSSDRGASWQLSEKVKPEKAGFVFRAPHDGEYWFGMRTVDAGGRARPDGQPAPGLKVVVDTLAPRLDLSAERGIAGEIIVRWRVLDPLLKSDSLKIEYQAGPSQAWEPLAIDPKTSIVARHTLTGEATWWPKSGATLVTIRAQVADRAGNPAVHQAQVKLEPAPLANSAAPSAFELQRGTTESQRSAANSQRSGTSPGNGSLKWPADRAAAAPSTVGTAAGNDPRANRPTDSGADPSWRPPARGASRTQNVSQRPANDVANQTLDLNLLPPGERPRMVNSRVFELEYEVESVGPSGIAKVELWGTRNGGRSWASFGADDDNRSPLAVNVDGEGIYGFRIVVHSGSGLGGLPPREGDLPEIWIGVDLTKPAANITGTESGRDAGELVVRWEASDELPDARPISLFFGDRPSGPWAPIASGLENTGVYAWRLDNRVPDQIYLRLEMRDEAGNVGSFTSPDPTSLDRQRPQGRIRNVRSVSQ